MIDYLAALLGEREEAEVDLAGRQVVLRRKEAADAGGPGEETGGQAAGDFLAREEEDGDAVWLEGDLLGSSPVLDGLAVADGAAAVAAWLEEVEVRTGGGEALYQALQRSGRAARLAAGGRETVTVTLPGKTAGAAEDWDGLDRAVQRDARRYDGGFTLY